MTQQESSISVSRLSATSLFIVVALAPFLIMMVVGATDPFLHMHVASAIEQQRAGNIHDSAAPLVRDAPLFYFITIPASEISGISLETMQYLPFAGIVMAIAFLSLCRRFLSIRPAMIATLALTWIFIPPNNYSIWPHAFGIATFTLFLAIYVNYVKKNTIRLALVLAVLLVSTNLYSYTAGLWTVSVTFFSSSMLLLRNSGEKPAFGIFLLSLIMFLGFGQIVYGSFLPAFSKNALDLGSIFTIENLFGITRTGELNPFSLGPSPFVLRVPGIIRFILFAAPMALVLLLTVLRRDAKRSEIGRRLPVQDFMLIPLLLTVVPDSLAYSLAGQPLLPAVLRFFFFVAPIATLVCVGILVSRTRRRDSRQPASKTAHVSMAQTVYGTVIVIVSVLSLFLSLYTGSISTSSDHYRNIDSSASWILENSDAQIVSDMQTIGRIEVVGAELHYSLIRYVDFSYFHASTYEYLKGSGGNISDYASGDYVFIFDLNTATHSAMGDNWVNLKPVQVLFPYVNQNIMLSKVYDKSSAAAYSSA